jgi:hypothetical protein
MANITINPAVQPTRFLGSIKTKAGSEFNIYATSSRQHVVMFPVALSGRQGQNGLPVKVADLTPRMRQKLGC